MHLRIGIGNLLKCGAALPLIVPNSKTNVNNKVSLPIVFFIVLPNDDNFAAEDRISAGFGCANGGDAVYCT